MDADKCSAIDEIVHNHYKACARHFVVCKSPDCLAMYARWKISDQYRPYILAAEGSD